MNNETRQHTEKLFLEISRTAARAKLYALRAEQDGNIPLANLFRAIATSQQAQTRRLLYQLRGQIGTNEQNCTTAFEDEIPHIIELYEKSMRALPKKEENVQCKLPFHSQPEHTVST